MANKITEWTPTFEEVRGWDVDQVETAMEDHILVTVRQAAAIAGVKPQRISDALRRPGNLPSLRMIPNKPLFHVEWIVAKWDKGEGSKAYRRGLEYFQHWCAAEF